MKKKGLTLVLALALMVVGAVGGTLAWLTAESDTVTNTFTSSDITVKLAETKGQGTSNKKTFKMIPGHELEKDPKAWVVSGSEDCFLFVKLDKSGDFDTYLTYEMAKGWEQVPGTTNVYSRKVTSNEMSADDGKTKAFPVLANNQVTVKDTVTKADMEALNKDSAAKPTLTITAYASQLYKNATVKFEPAEAWANVNPVNP